MNGSEEDFGTEQKIIETLAEKIEAGRKTLNQDERKVIYAEALDLVMQLAVELPTYQRNDLVVYNKEVINGLTLNQNPSATSSVFRQMWKVNYN